MNANELRIGNWVKLFDSDKPYKIHVVSKKVIQVVGDLLGGDLFNIKNVFPIELTPEILEKAGFVWSVYHQATHKEGFPFDLTEREEGLYSMYAFKKSTHITSGIKYTHQLQNLYYALTGEELPIEL